MKIRLVVFGIALCFVAAAASAQDPSIRVSTFATLPQVAPLNPGNPEGMAADSFGLLHVSTFDVSNICFSLPASPPNAFNYIFTYNQFGHLVAQTPFVPCGAPLGMQAIGHKLYVIDVFYGQVDRYQLPLTNTSAPDATYNICGGFLVAFGLPVKNGGPFCVLTDMKLGPDGRLYMADSGAGPAFVFSPNFETGRI